MIWLYLTQKILQPTLDPLQSPSKNIQTLQAPMVRSIEVNHRITPILTQIFMTLADSRQSTEMKFRHQKDHLHRLQVIFGKKFFTGDLKF